MPENKRNDVMRSPLTTHLVYCAALLLAFLLAAHRVHAEPGPVPSTDLSPAEVIDIVIESLRDNDQSEDDDGIATVFRFASPSNRAQTGPIERFTRMIKVGFDDMLTHVSSRKDPIRIDGDTALQAVWLMSPSGSEVGYAFQMGLQRDGEFEGMWMTESVLPLGEGAQSGTRI